MSEMFNNYPQPEDYIPNNRIKCICIKQLEVFPGGNAVHKFKVPFNAEDDCSMVEVIYEIGLEPSIIKSSLFDVEIEITPEGNSIIICRLKPKDTMKFNTSLETNAQVKFYMEDGTIQYTEVQKVYVKETLDSENRPEPEPQEQGQIAGIGGYGYTED